MTPSQRFTLEAGHWYALELMGEEFGPSLRTYSPLNVYRPFLDDPFLEHETVA